jgi:hypothetical protein
VRQATIDLAREEGNEYKRKRGKPWVRRSRGEREEISVKKSTEEWGSDISLSRGEIVRRREVSVGQRVRLRS